MLQCFRFCKVFIILKLSKMFKIVNPGFNFFNRRIINDSVKRYFLSNAYRCDEAWANRLKNPAFQKVDINNLYHELDLNFQQNKRISILDVDIFFSIINDATYKNELEDVLLRIRLCPECKILPERATHAAIRWYLDNASSEELFNVLSDRLNYGLFPNYHLTNLLIDKYLKEKDSRSAVKAAVLQMLQEDLDNPIMKALALHSCYSYLESPDIWQSFKEPPPDPEEEVVKVRVPFLRNPYFDDHFDIKDTNHLVGKTLWMFGCSVDETLGASSQLVGLVLYEKYEKCIRVLENMIQKGTKLHEEAVAKAKAYALKKPKQVEEEESEGEKKTEDVEDKVDKSKNRVLELLEKISEKNLVKGSLLTESAELVRKMVKENESSDIQQQCEVYKQWEQDREDLILYEIKRAELLKVKSEIEEMKTEMEKQEQKLFFFDREEELEMISKEKEKEMAGVTYYIEKKKKGSLTREEYIPPEVHQKKF